MPPRKSRNSKITYKDQESEDDLSPPPSPPSKADDDFVASLSVDQTRPGKRATRASTLASNDPDPAETPSLRTAGREVYNTLEIRERIFRLIDKETLAGMLRLEKAATASVAAVLYHTINVSLVSRMSRASPRRVTYCDAVRVLDRNPVPDFPNHRRTRSAKPPQDFDGQRLLKDLITLRKKYPNLKRIFHDFPAEASSDAYTVRLDDEEVHVNLQTVFHGNDYFPGLNNGSPKLPRSPEWPGVQLQHTIVFDNKSRSPRDYVDQDLNKRLKSWIYDNPDLDRRLAGLRLNHCFPASSYDEILAFLSALQQGDCEPLTEFTISYQGAQVMTVTRLGDLLALLGSGLRVLVVERRLIIDVGETLHTVMIMLNDRFPSLQKLSLKYTICSSDYHTEDYMHDCRYDVEHKPPEHIVGQWTGLPELRHLMLHPRKMGQAPLTLARYLARLGRVDCAYAYSMSDESLLTNHVRKHKSSRQEYAFLHDVNYADLDIWSLNDLPKLPAIDSGGKRRRLAWTTLDRSVATLADQQRQLEEASTKHHAAMTEYEKSISDIQAGLKGANGDTAVETGLLQEKFKTIAKRRISLTTACQELEALLASIKGKAEELAMYEEEWMKHQ